MTFVKNSQQQWNFYTSEAYQVKEETNISTFIFKIQNTLIKNLWGPERFHNLKPESIQIQCNNPIDEGKHYKAAEAEYHCCKV